MMCNHPIGTLFATNHFLFCLIFHILFLNHFYNFRSFSIKSLFLGLRPRGFNFQFTPFSSKLLFIFSFCSAIWAFGPRGAGLRPLFPHLFIRFAHSGLRPSCYLGRRPRWTSGACPIFYSLRESFFISRAFGPRDCSRLRRGFPPLRGGGSGPSGQRFLLSHSRLFRGDSPRTPLSFFSYGYSSLPGPFGPRQLGSAFGLRSLSCSSVASLPRWLICYANSPVFILRSREGLRPSLSLRGPHGTLWVPWA